MSETCDDTPIRLDTVPALDRQSDRWRDRQTDRQTELVKQYRALHALAHWRAIKTIEVALFLLGSTPER